MGGAAVSRWREKLRQTADVTRLLASESRLPGPRGNLELLSAYAEEADARHARRLVAENDPQHAPSNTPGEFLAACGVVALGRIALQGDGEAVAQLRAAASDPRWRVREGVAMALQRLGDDNPAALVSLCSDWAGGNRFEQRAAVAALCEPRLLQTPAVVGAALQVLQDTTASLVGAADRRTAGHTALRKALGYGWSVVAVADWPLVRPALEGWVAEPDRDVRWLVRENLRNARLVKLDADWVQRTLDRLA